MLLGRRRVVKRHHGEVNGVVLVEREGMNSSHNDGFPFFISLSVAQYKIGLEFIERSRSPTFMFAALIFSEMDW